MSDPFTVQAHDADSYALTVTQVDDATLKLVVVDTAADGAVVSTSTYDVSDVQSDGASGFSGRMQEFLFSLGVAETMTDEPGGAGVVNVKVTGVPVVGTLIKNYSLDAADYAALKAWVAAAFPDQ